VSRLENKKKPRRSVEKYLANSEKHYVKNMEIADRCESLELYGQLLYHLDQAAEDMFSILKYKRIKIKQDYCE